MEWKEVTLSELGTIVGGATPSTKITSFYDGNIPWLTPKDLSVNDNKYIFRGERNITEEGFKSCSCKMLPKGSILFSSRAPIGYVAIAANDMCTNQGFKSVIPNDETDSEFLYYLLKYNKNNIASQGSGTTFAEVSGKTMKEIEVVVPKEKDDQRHIASVLSSLDRKIELNNKINADLEEMAQAIFKNWFVDFEPFKNGKFVDSELGMIPEGWKVGSYSEMIESLISGDWGKETPQGNYTHEVACVRGCDFQDINNGVRGKTPQRYILEKNYQAKHLKDKDILVEISGGTATVSTGRTSLVTEELLKKYKHDIVCTNFCKVLRPLSQFSSYVYYSWKYKYDNDIMFGYENGTSGIKNFAIKDFIEKEPVLIPKEQDIVEFQKIIDNLQKQKQIKGTENTTLSLLRDTLLPRLMSGELEVPE